MAVPSVADRCWIELFDDEPGVRVEVGNPSPGAATPDNGVTEVFAGSIRLERNDLFRRVRDATEPILIPPGDVLGGTDCDLAPAVIAPLRTSDRSFGVLIVGRGRNRSPFHDEDIVLVGEFARRVALSFDNAVLYRQATDAIKIRDEFLSVSAHELKTPITAIRATAQLMIRHSNRLDLAQSAFPHRYFESIVIQSRRLARLVEQILDVSRLKSGQLSLTCRTGDHQPTGQRP